MDDFVPLESLSNDATCFNFGKVLKLSRLMKEQTPLECASWILNQYIPTMNNKKRHNISIRTIMFHFLSWYHSKKRNPITNDEFNKLICFDTTLKSGSVDDGIVNVSHTTTTRSECTINGKCSFSSLPESVICQNICPFLHLREIVSTFSKVCLLFAICSENGCAVKTLTVDPTKSKTGNINYKGENIRNHWYKCCKIEKLQLLGAPYHDHNHNHNHNSKINSRIYKNSGNSMHELKEYKFFNDILRRYQFSNLKSLTC